MRMPSSNESSAQPATRESRSIVLATRPPPAIVWVEDQPRGCPAVMPANRTNAYGGYRSRQAPSRHARVARHGVGRRSLSIESAARQSSKSVNDTRSRSGAFQGDVKAIRGCVTGLNDAVPTGGRRRGRGRNVARSKPTQPGEDRRVEFWHEAAAAVVPASLTKSCAVLPMAVVREPSESGSSVMPSRARIVVIGAGIVGNCLVGHLAELGWEDLVLIDKGPLPDPGRLHRPRLQLHLPHRSQPRDRDADAGEPAPVRGAGGEHYLRRGRGGAHRGAHGGAAAAHDFGALLGDRDRVAHTRTRWWPGCRSSTAT